MKTSSPPTRRSSRGSLTAIAGLALVALALPSTAAAITPPPGQRGPAGLEFRAGAAPRHARELAARPPSTPAAAAFSRFQAAHGPTIHAWDPATGAAAFLAPRGRKLAGVTADPELARQHAEALLAAHIELLAPGCDTSDFSLVSNERSGELRTIGFRQRRGPHEVLGGQLSFRFKGDHLTAIASQALPCRELPGASPTIEATLAATRAQAWIAEEGAATTTIVATDAPAILPRIGDTRLLGADLVFPVEIATTGPIGRWRVYVDAASGAPIARENLLHYAVQILYDVPRRGPLGARYNAPANRVDLDVGGQTLTTDAGGYAALDAPTALSTTVHGPFAQVLNEGFGGPASDAWVLSPGETLVWSLANIEESDAQLSAFVHTMLVKDHVRAIDPDLAWLDKQIQVTVNIPDICNAFSDGDTINFFASGGGCENTARLADVVYHEFGHSVHFQAIIPGVGAFHPSLSEGISDYLSATLTGDSGLARGFFLDDEPLRELDPDGFEWRWPEDQGEVHDEGRIIGGALWDLRKILRAKLGPAEGTAHTDYLWYESIRRAVDMQSMYMESLIADDNDGDLGNGTPNACEIAAAYGAHGLRSISAVVTDVALEGPGPNGYPVKVSAGGLLAGCPGGAPLGAALSWQRRDDPQIGGTTQMVPDGGGGFVGLIPPQEDGHVIQYQVEVLTSPGSSQILPSNLADPWYEFYVGPVDPLYCTDFEDNPYPAGWSAGGFSSDFEWAPVSGGGLDPSAAFSGSFAVGNDISGDGGYDPLTDATFTSPLIGTGGYPTVRLQYRRWLSVEDGFYDQATIEANGATVWENFASSWEDDASTHHVDGEWRFHDVDISAAAAAGAVSITFGLRSDGGLEMGGWTIDDLCVVGIPAMAAGICGDGVLVDGEACDDGNNVDGDGCSATCTIEPVGETETETMGATDTDTETDSATGGAGLDLTDRGCVCGLAREPSPAPAASLLLLALIARRRRR